MKVGSPAGTEMEMHMTDWLCKALGLPSFFLHHHPDSSGGGVMQVSSSLLCLLGKQLVILYFCFLVATDVFVYFFMSLQSTVSESTLVALMAARKNKILQLQAEEKEDESVLNSRLVAYTSDQASFYTHSWETLS